VAAAGVVDVKFNPNNSDQRYVMYGNGRIDAFGGAPAVTGQATWYTALNQPIVVAIHITDWTTGAGYQLDRYGAVHAFNGATALPGGVLSGVPYTPGVPKYVDWAWDTAANGQGYVLDQYGQVYPFGGASAPTFTGPRWSWPAAKKLKMQFTPSKRGVILDAWGGLQPEFGSTLTSTGAYWPRWDAARDFVPTGYNPITGYKLDLYGAVHGVNLSNPVGFPSRVGADVARILELLSASNPLEFWEVWSQGQTWDWFNSTPPTVLAGGGTNEVQTVTVTGAPTAGTFTLTYSGQTTATQSRTVTAAALQTALEALSNIGVGDVAVTGGPAGTAPLVVTFTGALGATDVAQMTAAHTFTGGTTPAVTVATITSGGNPSPATTVTTTTRPTLGWNYTDPQNDQQTEWRLLAFTQTFVGAHDMTDPTVWSTSALVDLSGLDAEQRGVIADYDFPNGTYRFYIRAKDSAGMWSAWSNRGWTQNIAAPATPTGLTATVDPTADKFRVNLSVTATTGGSANLIMFQFSLDGTTWYKVPGADARPLTATTTGTDYAPPLGQAVIYRAIAYATNPRVISAASTTATATVPKMLHVLTSTADPNLGGEFIVNDAPSWDREIVAGILQPVGDPYAVVLTDGVPKARQLPVTIGVNSVAEFDKLDDLIMNNAKLGGTLVWRDPFGEVIYCKAIGAYRRQQKKRLPYPTEPFPRGHKHQVTLTLQEIKPPYLISNPTTEAPNVND
jgi:hypothetical protein